MNSYFYFLTTEVCDCGWWADSGVGVYGSVRVSFGSVGGGMGFFFGVDGKLWVAVVVMVVLVSGVCSAVVVVIVVVE